MPSLIGNKPNQVPSNGDLGTLAFQDANSVNITGGVIDVNAGSATVASLSAAGDENTGLFFPAADTLAVTTGGTERVRVNSSGNVSVNTATSRTKLLVASSNESDTVTLGLVSGGFAVSNSNPSYGTQMGVLNSGSGWIQSMRMDSTATAYNLLLQPVGGNVGIGTSSPTAKLDVNGTAVLTQTTGTITARNSGSTVLEMHVRPNSGSNGFISFTENGVADRLVVGTEAGNGSFLFKTGNPTTNTERMRIDSSGNLGIGTASPTAMLDVNSNTVRVRTARTPASATATGNAGDICWDANYVYVCVATNTWKRSALSTW